MVVVEVVVEVVVVVVVAVVVMIKVIVIVEGTLNRSATVQGDENFLFKFSTELYF